MKKLILFLYIPILMSMNSSNKTYFFDGKVIEKEIQEIKEKKDIEKIKHDIKQRLKAVRSLDKNIHLLDSLEEYFHAVIELVHEIEKKCDHINIHEINSWINLKNEASTLLGDFYDMLC